MSEQYPTTNKVPLFRVIIRAIPHKEHRYPTCGDWWYDPEDGTLQIRVSQEMPLFSQQLVALHELAEVFMCAANGITQKQVDDFDMNYEANRQPGDESEPGEQPNAPYFAQHGLATAVERMAATQMGVVWPQHEQEIVKLFEPTPTDGNPT
jgi:hypothetical protein